MIFSNPRHWLKWLAFVNWWYRTNYHTSLQTTPFKTVACVAQRLNMLQNLKDNLEVAQARLKFCVDHNITDRILEVGDYV